MTDTEKIQAIQTGQQFSKYDEWIHSKNPDVRAALALAGQFPHILIRDENEKCDVVWQLPNRIISFTSFETRKMVQV